jgi:3-hydroxymyristoyl/3-hydroxydecanoyl-(acyl carrier protein) dehydratase
MEQGQQVHVYANGSLYEGHYEGDIVMPGIIPDTMCLIRLFDGTLGIFRRAGVRVTRTLPELVSARV